MQDINKIYFSDFKGVILDELREVQEKRREWGAYPASVLFRSATM